MRQVLTYVNVFVCHKVAALEIVFTTYFVVVSLDGVGCKAKKSKDKAARYEGSGASISAWLY